MKRVNYILFFCCYIILISCNTGKKTNCNTGFEVEIEFVNKSQKTSLSINELKFSNDSNQSQKKILCFDNISKTDGNYKFHIKNKRLDTIIIWGYYSNGIPSDNKIKVLLVGDSATIKGEN